MLAAALFPFASEPNLKKMANQPRGDLFSRQRQRKFAFPAFSPKPNRPELDR
jgi:hypothetical protein